MIFNKTIYTHHVVFCSFDVPHDEVYVDMYSTHDISGCFEYIHIPLNETSSDDGMGDI